MIQILKGADELGFALYDLNTDLFQYGEVCDKTRLMHVINSFPEHEVEIYVERAWVDDLEELYYLMPYLKDMARVRVVKKLSVPRMIAGATEPVRQKNFTYLYIAIGIILGSLLLLPTSLEYRNSVLSKAQNVVAMSEEYRETQPDNESKKQLYTYVETLNQVVNVESITYLDGQFVIVFSSGKGDLGVESFSGIPGAQLEKTTSLKSEDGQEVHLYELEGTL